MKSPSSRETTFLQGPDINGCEAETPPCPCLLLLLTDECVYLCCCCHQTSDSLGSNVDWRAEAHTPRIFHISVVRLDCWSIQLDGLSSYWGLGHSRTPVALRSTQPISTEPFSHCLLALCLWIIHSAQTPSVPAEGITSKRPSGSVLRDRHLANSSQIPGILNKGIKVVWTLVQMKKVSVLLNLASGSLRTDSKPFLSRQEKWRTTDLWPRHSSNLPLLLVRGCQRNSLLPQAYVELTT